MYKQTLSLVACATLVASLGARELTLDPIIVSASKTEQSLKETTANITIITADEIEEKHYTTLGEALNAQTGISVISNGGLGKSTSAYVRGFDSKRILVLIDGVRYNDHTSMDGASFEHLLLGNVEQIEVIKGSQSGIWGSDASAGVINIITRKADIGSSGAVRFEYGSYATKKYGANASYNNGTVDLELGGEKILSNGFSAYARRYYNLKQYENDGYENRTLNFKGGYRFDDQNRIRFLHTDIESYSEYDGTTGDSSAYYDKQERLSRLMYENHFGIALTTLYVNRSTFERDYSTRSTFDGRTDEYGIQTKLGYRESDFIVIGGDYKSFEHLNQLNKHYANKALFVTNTNHIGTKTFITESLRRDTFDTFKDQTTGKIGVKHFMTEDLFVGANYGIAYNVPTLFQMYAPIYGNANVQPEDTRSYDFSLGYKGVGITYFESRIKEMIDYDSASLRYNNIQGTSYLKGFEVEYKQEVIGDTYLSLGFTRLSAKNQRGENLRRRAKKNLKFGVDYYGFSKMHIGLNGEYVGSRFDSDNDRGVQTGRHTVANAVVNYELTRTIKIYGKVDNITDKYYQNITNYATSPRAYYVGMEVSF